MKKHDDDGRARKHVSWSPVVKAVYRPTSARQPFRVAKRESVVELKEPHSGLHRTVRGTMVAHARRDTHSLLLTIRRGSHRDVQLLIDLPKRKIRRVYDGQRSWNVIGDESESAARMTMTCRVDSVTWKDDRKTRSTDSRGFDVDWVKGTRVLSVQASSARSHHPLPSVSKKYRSARLHRANSRPRRSTAAAAKRQRQSRPGAPSRQSRRRPSRARRSRSRSKRRRR